jgi:hypothetical protein
MVGFFTPSFIMNVENLPLTKKGICWEFDVDANMYKCLLGYCKGGMYKTLKPPLFPLFFKHSCFAKWSKVGHP